MGLKNVIFRLNRTLFELIVASGIIFSGLAFLPNQLFSDFQFEPQAYELPSYDPAVAFKAWNSKLSTAKTQLLLNGQIVGPESLAEYKGSIYTGLADGRLVEINKKTGSLRTVTSFPVREDAICVDNQPNQLAECGRPLGLRFDANGLLYVIEASQGLFQVNVTSGQQFKVPLEIRPELRGLYNDLVFDPVRPHIVYITVSSTRWALDRVVWSLMEHENSGLVLAADLRNNRVYKVAGGFYFTNGIDVINDILLVSESSAFRVSRISLKDVRKMIDSGSETNIAVGTFVDNLIGEPDNVRVHGQDVLVSLVSARVSGPTVGDHLASYPMVRKTAGRLLYIVYLILKFVDDLNIYYDAAFKDLLFQFYSGHLLYQTVPTFGTVLKLDALSGELDEIYGSNSFCCISEALIDSQTGDLYLGSFRNKFLARYPGAVA